jgi:hypothetical protein
MTAGVNFLELFDRDLRVNGRGVELLVAEQPLDEADVGTVFKHVGGAGVASKCADLGAWIGTNSAKLLLLLCREQRRRQKRVG